MNYNATLYEKLGKHNFVYSQLSIILTSTNTESYWICIQQAQNGHKCAMVFATSNLRCNIKQQ